jgi:hypothetical protein
MNRPISTSVVFVALSGLAFAFPGCAHSSLPAQINRAGGEPTSTVQIEEESAVLPVRGEMMVETGPHGGVVVVDGRPVGPAPQAVVLPVTERGYLSRPVSVKVRFVANDGFQPSTTEIWLTPTDRAPSRLLVTPNGSRRQHSLDG